MTDNEKYESSIGGIVPPVSQHEQTEEEPIERRGIVPPENPSPPLDEPISPSNGDEGDLDQDTPDPSND